MPSKKTRPDRLRRPGTGSALSDRPAARPNGLQGPSRPTGTPSARRLDPRPPRPRKTSTWKTVRENIGWSLVIGLPIILVVLAILWRATNGFQGNPADKPLPTIAPTVTAGSYLAPPPVPGGAKPSRILYLQASAPNQPMQLFSANQDGSNPAQLTNTAENKSSPSWSPDGRQVIFAADGIGIQMVNFDGSGLHTVAYNGFSPVWAPDSTKIAFLKQEPASGGAGPDNNGLVRFLYVTKAAGRPGDEKQVAFDAMGPNWSPDSKDIAFFSLRNGVMFTVGADGGQATQLQTGGLGGWLPTFTPDGNLVFYGFKNPAKIIQNLDFGSLTPASGPANGGSPTAAATTAAITPGTTFTPVPTATPIPPAVVGLYRMNRDGSNLKQLSEIENPGANPKTDIPSFATFVEYSAEGTALLSNRPSFKSSLVLSPDGKTVAGLAGGLGRDKAGIVVIPVEGGNSLNIVSGENGLEAGTRLNPTFSADGSKIYYWFQAESGKNKELRAFDLNSKQESPLLKSGDISFPVCCGQKS